MNIHPTAVIESGAEIHESATIGAFTVIEKNVVIGPDCTIGPHAFVSGHVSMGTGNKIGPFTCIGTPPQDLKYNGEDTRVVIGDHNTIREYVSIHRGTTHDSGQTTIGSHNLVMAYCHIAHDCTLGDWVIMANCATLGGHVEVGDYANFGGMVGVHQFSRIGAHTYIGGMSGIGKDVPPYVIASGVRNKMRITGINKVGLKRSGYDQEAIKKVQKAFGYIFRSSEMLLNEALDKSLAEFPDCEPVVTLVEFFRSSNRMGVYRIFNGKE